MKVKNFRELCICKRKIVMNTCLKCISYEIHITRFNNYYK